MRFAPGERSAADLRIIKNQRAREKRRDQALGIDPVTDEPFEPGDLCAPNKPAAMTTRSSARKPKLG